MLATCPAGFSVLIPCSGKQIVFFSASLRENKVYGVQKERKDKTETQNPCIAQRRQGAKEGKTTYCQLR
jgi:hypothetical protein